MTTTTQTTTTKERQAIEVAKLEAELNALKVDAKKPGNLSPILEKMLVLEKSYRLSAAILAVLRQANDWQGICEHVVLLSKRRAQLKQAIGAVVREAITTSTKRQT